MYIHVTMPVIVRFGRFKFVVYPKDHAPAHVLVLGPKAEAKFDIRSGECIAAYGFAAHTLNQLKDIVMRNSDLLMEAWRDYEGED
jgi:nitrite reductase/ring-hydroxylating ferredoxin subunit